MTCLFVGNITKSLTEQKLVNIFSKVGPCQVELKGPYAFIEYENANDSKEAMQQFNKTTLNGLNGHAKVRIEFSKKKKVNDKLEDNDNSNNPLNFLKNSTDPPANPVLSSNASFPDMATNNNDIDISESSYDNSSRKAKSKHTSSSMNDNGVKTKKEEEYYSQQKRNMCFICKLPGHFAKECVLTKDSCYECGEKGHMAKECQAGVREAKFLTKNRIKAVFSQQSAYKFISPKTKIRNIINYMKESELN